MGFATYDAIIAAITAGQQIRWDPAKVGGAMQGAGIWHSLARASGTPGAVADPATTPGNAYTNLAGSMNWADQSPDTKHGLTLGGVATGNCTLMVYDRLVGVSQSLVSTGDKTINSAALPRYTDGIGVEVWAEVTTQTATSAAVARLKSYTDDSNNAAQDAVATLTFPAAATLINTLVGPFPILAGDKGVRSVETMNVATAPTAGVINLLLIKPLFFLPLIANQWNEKDLVLQLAGLDRIYDGASLCFAVLATSGTAVTFWGTLRGAYD